MKNIKLFSHTDLDGIGCNILIRNLPCNNSIENLNYDKVNERIKEFIVSDEYLEYDYIFITDISVNEEVAELLDEIYMGKEVALLDHHKTALWLNKYGWATVEENIKYNNDEPTEKTSGTELLYKYILCNYDSMGIEFQYDNNIADFVTQVKRYDTWLWNTKYNNNLPKQLNDLLYILGRERFINAIEYNNYNVSKFINDNILLLELEQEKIDKYIASKNKELKECYIEEYKVGVVFADHNQSELGNKLSELNPKLDVIAMIGNNTVSYRSIKDNVDCSKIAKLYNGGGHAKASGNQIGGNIQNNIIDLIFNRDNVLYCMP